MALSLLSVHSLTPPTLASPRRRSGLTILELVISITIVALLLALLFPALQQSREAARRVECGSNLRQIGLALFLYHDTHGCLPPGWIEDGSTPAGWGWASQLLPQLGQAPLADEIHFDLPVGAGPNTVARTQSLPVFLCPSDHVPRSYVLHRQGTHQWHPLRASTASSSSSTAPSTALFELAGASYVGIFGTDEPDDTPGDLGTGVFLANRPVRLSEIRRGPSHMLFIGERTAEQFPSAWAGTDLDAEETPAQVVGAANHPPNHPDADETEFSSRHPGGANFLMGDGRINFISNDVDATLYRQQALRNDP